MRFKPDNIMFEIYDDTNNERNKIMENKYQDKLEILYMKLSKEQNAYREWIKKQKPEDILLNAYEYVIREDFLATMESITNNNFDFDFLNKEQIQALLTSSALMDSLYRCFEKLESTHAELIEDTIRDFADKVLKRNQELLNTPLYLHDYTYAQKQKESCYFFASHNANVACKEWIEKSIDQYYKDDRLDSKVVQAVLQRFNADRVLYVLANTVQQKKWDGRFSVDNKKWADTVTIPEKVTNKFDFRSEYIVDRCHTGFTDLFLTLLRKQIADSQQLQLNNNK